ncbi:hypothetical protein F5Y12DRAFT_792781 [Xylaria sp. FL1777]|nr:hypothetical protein F5Y12DRAFT_792781 [Xylaria sp. FL1777]
MPSDWQSLINKRVALVKLCLATENFTPFHVLAAQQATGPSVRDDLPTEVADAVDKINADTVGAGEQDFKEFLDQVQTLKDQKPDEEAWKKTISDAAATATAKCAAAIEKAKVDALQLIANLPETLRVPASQLWKEGLTAVAAFFESVYRSFKDIAQAVYQFLKNIWGQITTSLNTILSAAQAAIDLINGLVSPSAPSATPILLPASTSLSHVQSQIGSYLQQLSSSADPASTVTVNKQNRGWEITVI